MQKKVKNLLHFVKKNDIVKSLNRIKQLIIFNLLSSLLFVINNHILKDMIRLLKFIEYYSVMVIFNKWFECH